MKQIIIDLFDRIHLFARRGLYTGHSNHEYAQVGPPVARPAEEYFLFRQKERKNFIADLSRNLKLEDMSFCSIGSGFGGEEYLLQDNVKKLILIEPDVNSCKFLRKKFHSSTQIFCGPLQCFEDESQFDLIYTSSPSNWMYTSPWRGIPGDLLGFIENHLKPEGIFLARLYGGIHSADVLRSSYYINILRRQLSQSHFKILYYRLSPNMRQAILVLSRTSSSKTSKDLILSDECLLVIQDNNVLWKHKVNLSNKLLTVLRLIKYVPVKIILGAFHVLYKAYKEVFVNLAMLGDNDR